MRRRFRLWRLRRAYRTIALQEAALGFAPEAVQLRLDFTAHTGVMVDVQKHFRGLTRQQRRREQERLVGRRR